jgi:cytochrome c biogenesis protein ResB
MKFQVQISEYLPRAVARPRYVPENLRPGLEPAGGITPAARCLLTVGKDKKEFWVGQTDNGVTDVTVGGESFRVGYNVRALDLGFEIKLLRAVETYDPGTQQKASYTSFVKLTDKQENIVGEDRIIYMNQPLNHRGYKFFQSGYRLLEMDQRTYKPISLSTFTVSYDPGLWMKYLGSSMLALGIVCMFYMKAYFFKPRGRQATA